jgi:transcription elongation factor Elf1
MGCYAPDCRTECDTFITQPNPYSITKSLGEIMGRRRRKVYKPVRKTLPKIFNCPRCGAPSVKVIKKSEEFHVICGSCGLAFSSVPPRPREVIDIFNDFVDAFYKGKIGA